MYCGQSGHFLNKPRRPVVLNLLDTRTKSRREICSSAHIKNNTSIFYLRVLINNYWATLWRSLLRHCAASSHGREFDSRWSNWNFHWHNPSGYTLSLGSTQPLKQMSLSYIFWGKSWPVHKTDKLTTFMCWFSWNLGASTSWNPQVLPVP